MSHKIDDGWKQNKTRWVEKPSTATLSMNKILVLGRQLGAETERQRIIKLIKESKIKSLEELVESFMNVKVPDGVIELVQEEQSNES